jgi:hypothetical protein
MAQIDIINETTIKIHVQLDDAVKMVQEAASHMEQYASDVVTIFEKMPFFDYTSFCFYAYDTASLFEWLLGMNPKKYNSFSLDAPDSFFYALYGGFAGLYEEAKKHAVVA